jgi:hypothetical protein
MDEINPDVFAAIGEPVDVSGGRRGRAGVIGLTLTVVAAAGEQQEREDSKVSPKAHRLMLLPLASIVEYAQAFCHNPFGLLGLN